MSEDWLAVVVGLGLVALVVAQVIWQVYFLATAANTALALVAAWLLFA